MAQDYSKQIEETLAKLRQERDELRVKLKLASMEARDDWQATEAKLRTLEAKAKELRGATAESARDVGAAASLLAEEIADAFKNIAKHF